MADEDDLPESAQVAQSILAQLGMSTEMFASIASGDWDAELGSPELRADAKSLIDALIEYVRYNRVAMNGLRSPMAEPALRVAERMAQDRLPFNRKERYFTGTVLPMLVASDGFAHLDRFLSMCGLPSSFSTDFEGTGHLQFFTEYSFNESVFTDADDARFIDRPPVADTPDLVIVGSDWLLAIEAKMFHRPSPARLASQLGRQAILVAYWASKFGIPQERVRHVALLPRALASTTGQLPVPVVTWEQVADSYRHVAPRYWLAQLDFANKSDLASKAPAWGTNADGERLGRQIARGDIVDPESGEVFRSMGRNGGLGGQLLSEDIVSGRWRTHRYEVCFDDPPNSNWFPISDFLRSVGDIGKL